MHIHDLIVVGSGISGLSFAFFAQQRGLKPLILEQSQRIGGSIYSYQFEQLDNFFLELGAHSCFNSYQYLLNIIEKLGLLPQLIKRQNASFKLFKSQQLVSIPSQLRFFELAFSLPHLLFESKTDKSVKDYYQKVIGQRNYDAVFSHAFNAVICQSADNFPADALFRKRQRRRDVVKSFSFAMGIQTIIEELARYLKQQTGLAIQTQQTLCRVLYQNELFYVKTNDGNEYVARHLAIATPVNSAATLLDESFPTIAQLLRLIEVAPIESLGVVVEQQKLAHLPPLGGIIGINAPFYSAVSRDPVLLNTATARQYRGFTFHFKPAQLSLELKQQVAAQALGIRPADFSSTIHQFNQLPALKVGHEGLITKLDNLLNQSRLAIIGNYLTGVAIEDCVTRSWEQSCRLFHI